MKSYLDFKLAVRNRESSNNYQCQNKFGFIGAYQFGMPRLSDFGFTTITSIGRYEWKIPWSLQVFLESVTLQDSIFDIHVKQLSLRVKKYYPDTDQEHLSGFVMVGHLLGFGGIVSLKGGEDNRDGLGTKASDYLSLFSGYNLF